MHMYPTVEEVEAYVRRKWPDDRWDENTTATDRERQRYFVESDAGIYIDLRFRESSEKWRAYVSWYDQVFDKEIDVHASFRRWDTAIDMAVIELFEALELHLRATKMAFDIIHGTLEIISNTEQ